MLQQCCKQLGQYENPAMAEQREGDQEIRPEKWKGRGTYKKEMQEKSKQWHKPTNKEEENKTDIASEREKIDAETAGEKSRAKYELKICIKLFQHQTEETLTIKTKRCTQVLYAFINSQKNTIYLFFFIAEYLF